MGKWALAFVHIQELYQTDHHCVPYANNDDEDHDTRHTDTAGTADSDSTDSTDSTDPTRHYTDQTQAHHVHVRR